MKKTRFLALALVVAIALMGAGYAMWTDQLVVKAEVQTGKLDVDFIEVKTPGRGYSDPTLVTITENNNMIKALGDNADNGNDRDLVEIKIGNFYPKAEVKRTVTLKNVGSIPAIVNVKDFELVAQGKGDVYKHVNAKVTRSNPYTPKLAGELEELDVEFQHHPQPTYVELAVGQSLDLDLVFTFLESAPNEVTEEQTVSYVLTMNFKQFNDR